MFYRTMTKQCNSAAGDRGRRAGFTLTELLVAIGLLLIIMLSVSTVFRVTGETVSTGVATLEMNRRMVTAQTALAGDVTGYGADPFEAGSGIWLANADPTLGKNPPFLIIRNNAQYAFLDRAEWVAANGSPPSQMYRTDSVAFFSRGVYKRQTGGYRNLTDASKPPYAWPLVSDMFGLDQAYIWYGHARQPDNGASWPSTYNHASPTIPAGISFWNPGAGTPLTNPNNFFASQWLLARSQIALVESQAHPTVPLLYPDFVPDTEQNAVFYYGRDSAAPPSDLAPLADGRATCGDGNFINGERIAESRYDIAGLTAGMTWTQYADIIDGYWRGSGTPLVPQRPDWAENRFSTRFRVNPFAIGEAGDRATFAAYSSQQVPMFLPGCVQMIVDFAGDYVTQDDDGDVSSGKNTPLNLADSGTFYLDGEIDYDVVDIGADKVRRIHWYGLPRRTDGSTGAVRFGTDTKTLTSGDVTTVSQMRAQSVGASRLMPFEWWDSDTYTCGWTRSMLFVPGTPPQTLAPQLIRITLQISDPEGRVRDGMTRQFVFPVKRIAY